MDTRETLSGPQLLSSSTFIGLLCFHKVSDEAIFIFTRLVVFPDTELNLLDRSTLSNDAFIINQRRVLLKFEALFVESSTLASENLFYFLALIMNLQYCKNIEWDVCTFAIENKVKLKGQSRKKCPSF